MNTYIEYVPVLLTDDASVALTKLILFVESVCSLRVTLTRVRVSSVKSFNLTVSLISLSEGLMFLYSDTNICCWYIKHWHVCDWSVTLHTIPLTTIVQKEQGRLFSYVDIFSRNPSGLSWQLSVFSIKLTWTYPSLFASTVSFTGSASFTSAPELKMLKQRLLSCGAIF